MNTIFFSPVEFAGAGEEELLHQIEEHKYLANQTIPFEISMEEAYESWSLLVHAPLSEAIETEGLDKAFPEVAKGELYLWVSRHWYFMKKNGTVEVTAREAVLDFGARFADNALNRFGFFLKKVAA
jgi:hypothetical protein